MPTLIQLIKQPEILVGICIILVGMIGIILWIISEVRQPRRKEMSGSIPKTTLTTIEDLLNLVKAQAESYPNIENRLQELGDKLASVSQHYQQSKEMFTQFSKFDERLAELVKHQEDRLSTLQNMFESLDAQLVKLNNFFEQVQKKKATDDTVE